MPDGSQPPPLTVFGRPAGRPPNRGPVNRLGTARLDWARLREALEALNPAAVLGRGFSVVRTPQGEVVRDSNQVSAGRKVEVILSRGGLDCRVEAVHPEKTISNVADEESRKKNT